MADSAHTRKASVLNAVFQGYDGPSFSVRLWDGWQWSSPTNDRPVCSLVVNSPKGLASLVARPDQVTLGEAFIRGALDVEGDLFSVFQVAEHLFNRPRGWWQQAVEKWAGTLFGVTQWL